MQVLDIKILGLTTSHFMHFKLENTCLIFLQTGMKRIKIFSLITGPYSLEKELYFSCISKEKHQISPKMENKKAMK